MQFSFELRVRRTVLSEIGFMISSTFGFTEFVQLNFDRIKFELSSTFDPAIGVYTRLDRLKSSSCISRENEGTERVIQGVGWDMSIPLKLFLVLDGNGSLFPQTSAWYLSPVDQGIEKAVSVEIRFVSRSA